MRLKTSNSKNSTLFYVIKDYTTLNGKRTTEIFKKLGNQSKVEERFGKTDTLNQIKKYIDKLNNENKEEILKHEFNSNKQISLNTKRKFNFIANKYSLNSTHFFSTKKFS